jgi:hypothetical protein
MLNKKFVIPKLAAAPITLTNFRGWPLTKVLNVRKIVLQTLRTKLFLNHRRCHHCCVLAASTTGVDVASYAIEMMFTNFSAAIVLPPLRKQRHTGDFCVLFTYNLAIFHPLLSTHFTNGDSVKNYTFSPNEVLVLVQQSTCIDLQ